MSVLLFYYWAHYRFVDDFVRIVIKFDLNSFKRGKY